MTSSSSLPIVFIPGATSDDTVWDQEKDYFANKTTAVSVNLTNFQSVEDMSDHVLQAAPEEFIVCGTSMGGYVALDILKKAKHRVKKIVFCNTSARADTPERARQRKADIDAGEEAYIRNRQDENHYRAFLSEKSFRNKPLIGRLHDISMRVGFGCFERHQKACSRRPDSLSFLSQIDIPTLIIGGAEDTVTPPELQIEMHEAIAGSSLKILPDVGHIAHMESADALTAEIEKFLFTD